ncbi:MAG: hypothetical protein ACRD4X_16815, partial [Candidatus Acidiferrales bacterium]
MCATPNQSLRFAVVGLDVALAGMSGGLARVPNENGALQRPLTVLVFDPVTADPVAPGGRA